MRYFPRPTYPVLSRYVESPKHHTEGSRRAKIWTGQMMHLLCMRAEDRVDCCFLSSVLDYEVGESSPQLVGRIYHLQIIKYLLWLKCIIYGSSVRGYNVHLVETNGSFQNHPNS